jgi:sigma-E factor negative regulatory protein RseC
MLKEQGIIVAIESDAVWVETIQQSTCNTCVAKKGCGQRLLSKTGVGSAKLRVLVSHNDPTCYKINDQVTLAIPEDVVVNGSLFVYLLPLCTMIVFSGFAHTLLNSEIASVLSGISGFFLGGLLIRYHSVLSKHNPRLQPVLLLESEVEQ